MLSPMAYRVPCRRILENPVVVYHLERRPNIAWWETLELGSPIATTQVGRLADRPAEVMRSREKQHAASILPRITASRGYHVYAAADGNYCRKENGRRVCVQRANRSLWSASATVVVACIFSLDHMHPGYLYSPLGSSSSR